MDPSINPELCLHLHKIDHRSSISFPDAHLLRYAFAVQYEAETGVQHTTLLYCVNEAQVPSKQITLGQKLYTSKQYC